MVCFLNIELYLFNNWIDKKNGVFKGIGDLFLFFNVFN